MAQWVKVLAANLSLIPRTHMEEGERTGNLSSDLHMYTVAGTHSEFSLGRPVHFSGCTLDFKRKLSRV